MTAHRSGGAGVGTKSSASRRNLRFPTFCAVVVVACSAVALPTAPVRGAPSRNPVKKSAVSRDACSLLGSSEADHVSVRARQAKASAEDGPPMEAGPFREPELVELVRLDRSIRLDIRYATSNNFIGRPVYEEARAFLQRPAAEALVRANRTLRKRGYGLLVFDGYRPWSVTKIFWDATPEDQKDFVADPKEGSRHNRGCAVDLSLFELSTGREVEMPSGYDEATERSDINYAGGSAESRRLRGLLRAAMEEEGFAVYELEWWHYDYKDWSQYPILNIKFSEIKASS